MRKVFQVPGQTLFLSVKPVLSYLGNLATCFEAFLPKGFKPEEAGLGEPQPEV